jgi:hypothetical protein
MSKRTARSLRSKTKTDLEDEIAERDQCFAALKNELEQQRNVIDRLNEHPRDVEHMMEERGPVRSCGRLLAIFSFVPPSTMSQAPTMTLRRGSRGRFCSGDERLQVVFLPLMASTVSRHCLCSTPPLVRFVIVSSFGGCERVLPNDSCERYPLWAITENRRGRRWHFRPRGTVEAVRRVS